VRAVCADATPAVALAALIVADSNDDAELVVRALQKAGYLPVWWRRVENAVGMEIALAEESWDVALSGHRMSSLDSFKALAVLGASGLEIPMIVVSGAIVEATAVAAMPAGGEYFVGKDHLDWLAAAVSRCLRGKREEHGKPEGAEPAGCVRAGSASRCRSRRSTRVLLRPLRDQAGEIVDFVYEYANDAACETNVLEREGLVGMRYWSGWHSSPR
jgi:DNA-binding response OmpR family regulator